MNRRIAALSLSLVASLLLARGAAAQNLVVTNARIIVGPGQVIERGAIVVRDGRIASVAAGQAPAAPAGAKVIDGTGMTVMAGYIDVHRHIIQGRGANMAQWRSSSSRTAT
jgi:imidazolonepropionase-like amidohydrolase